MDVLLQNFSQEIAGDMSGLLFLTAESVVGIGHQVPFALLVQIVETLTIGVRHYSVGIAMPCQYFITSSSSAAASANTSGKRATKR